MQKELLVRKILRRIEDEFEKRLQRKNGWGKNELMLEYQRAVTDVLAQTMDEATS